MQQVNIESAQLDTVKLQAEEEFFNSRKSNFDWYGLQKLFEPFRILWSTVESISGELISWKMLPFQSLDPEIIENKLKEWERNLNSSLQTLKSFEPSVRAALYFLKSIKEFDSCKVLILRLQHPGQHTHNLSFSFNSCVYL